MAIKLASPLQRVYCLGWLAGQRLRAMLAPRRRSVWRLLVP